MAHTLRYPDKASSKTSPRTMKVETLRNAAAYIAARFAEFDDLVYAKLKAIADHAHTIIDEDNSMTDGDEVA